jgi:transposase, IS30 family
MSVWIAGRLRDTSGREEVWRLRAAGLKPSAIAVEAGLSLTAVNQWIREHGGVRPRPKTPASGRYLSAEEREQIGLLLAEGAKPAQIARELGRHPSTIGREIKRNSDPVFGTRVTRKYTPSRAHRRAQTRLPRPKPAKLRADVHPELHAHVQAKLKVKWSPEQIAQHLPVAFPDRPEMRVSHETIYQAIYVQSRGALRQELASCLRTGRAVRRPKRRSTERRPRVPAELLISERPAEVEDRAVPGHWEGDLIIGKDNGSAVGTLVERTTRFCLLLHLPGKHGAEQVRDAIIGTITTLPQALRSTLTWDQGIELNHHAQITLATDLAIYFCDPHSPWQRGSNENTNGLLRQYLPKGTDLRQHSAARLAEIAAELNDRPRKTLGWRSPREALNELLVATTA